MNDSPSVTTQGNVAGRQAGAHSGGDARTDLFPGANAAAAAGGGSRRPPSDPSPAGRFEEAVPRGGAHVEGAGRDTSFPSAAPHAGALLRILRHCSAEKPVTQLDAGIALGFSGGKESVRRSVQHLREDLTAAGHIVCADGRGMWLAETEKEIDSYYRWLLTKSHSTLRTAAFVKRVSLRRLIRDLYESLREDAEEGPPAPRQPEMRVRRVEAAPRADMPKCSYCEKPFEGPRGRAHLTLYCSATCRWRAANDRKAAS